MNKYATERGAKHFKKDTKPLNKKKARKHNMKMGSNIKYSPASKPNIDQHDIGQPPLKKQRVQSQSKECPNHAKSTASSHEAGKFMDILKQGNQSTDTSFLWNNSYLTSVAALAAIPNQINPNFATLHNNYQNLLETSSRLELLKLVQKGQSQQLVNLMSQGPYALSYLHPQVRQTYEVLTSSATIPCVQSTTTPSSIKALSSAVHLNQLMSNTLNAPHYSISATKHNADTTQRSLLQSLSNVNAPSPAYPDLQSINTNKCGGKTQASMPSLPNEQDKNHFPLGIDEDCNWLSEFHCFVRSEIAEVFQASHQDLEDRRTSKSIVYQQVGIRCRHCTHVPASSRSTRSSAFPSSISQIYQSFNMMVREHFGQCWAIPEKTKENFFKLKKRNCQGDINSKEYWKYSAAKLGMVDSNIGIILNEKSQTQGLLLPPFGTQLTAQEPTLPHITGDVLSPLISAEDKSLVSETFYIFMMQVQPVTLKTWEHKTCRKSLKKGSSGLSCKHCWQAGRYGLCRTFPQKRSAISTSIDVLFDHFRRCSLCPPNTKTLLAQLEKSEEKAFRDNSQNMKEFYDRLWGKLERKRMKQP